METLKNKKVLVVDDEETICEILAASLQDEGCLVEIAHEGRSAIEKMKSFKPDVMLLDVWMPGDLDGIGVLKEIIHQHYAPQVLVMSGHGTIDTAVKAVKLGAWDFIEKPISIDKVLITLKNMLSFKSQQRERGALLNQLKESYILVGASPVMQNIKSVVMKLGLSSSPYFLSGEEGVGKSLVARNIHFVSTRAGFPFVVLNAQLLSESLEDKEIWGDPDSDLLGYLPAAQGGSLFIKNVEALSLASQERLSDFLREKESQRTYNVRVVASSTKNLAQLVKEGLFREDFYRRITALSVEIKNLKERKEDVALLAEHFCYDYSRKTGQPLRSFSEAALKLLEAYEWPGNVMELKNFVERVHILSDSKSFDMADLHYAGLQSKVSSYLSGYGDFREARAQFEKEYLIAKILENGGNISRTSEAIGLERSYLHRKIKAYKIDLDAIEKG